MIEALRRHWPEYLCEGWALGTFMVSATVFTVLFEAVVREAATQRLLIGIAMGATAVALIHSRAGRRSGAHMNPAVTLAFWRLGKIGGADAAGYVAAQVAGGTVGALLGAAAVAPFAGPGAARRVVTVPGPGGAGVAFVAEAAISFLLMLVVLCASNHPRTERWTGLFAGALVALFILVEAPLSGMSMNPARTLASALPARTFTALWVYLLAPPVGMLAAASVYVHATGRDPLCAKLRHDAFSRCLFRCGHAAAPAGRAAPAEGVRHVA